MKNKNMYYMIWADCMYRIKSNPSNKGLWKFNSFIAMTLTMTINLMVIMAILQRNILHYSFYDIDLSFIPNDFVKTLLSGVLLFFLPPALVNYILVFWKKRYIEIEQKYKSRKENLFVIYFFVSLFGPFVIGLAYLGIKQLF